MEIILLSLVKKLMSNLYLLFVGIVDGHFHGENGAEPGAPAVDRVIGDDVRFPKGSIIGALVRGDETVVPRGGDVILPGDTVIAFALASVVDDLDGMFSRPARGS